MDTGADVHCLMTPSACKFVSPLTFSALSGHPVATDIWDGKLWSMAHLDLALTASLMIVAPASADTLARLAHGNASDIVCAAALSTKAPLLLAPAMHESMWLNPATQENVRKLKSYGYKFIGPEKGPLARGDFGLGRLAAIPEIVTRAKKFLD
jgi:phosphopantothenoylcysteine decarboxylase/phosphopantothenate--cysteine ligase